MKKLLLAVAIAACAFSAQAVELSPLSKVYAPSEKSGVFTLRNTDSEARTYQITVSAWNVVDGKAVLTPSRDLRFFPSLITVAPNSKQTIRYMHSGVVSGSEVRYRFVVDDITQLPPATKNGLRLKFRSSIPWIWRPAGLSPKLSARWEGGDLVIANNGTATAQLVRLTAGPVKQDGLVGYVLPGASEVFKLHAKTRASSVSVVVNGEAQVLDVK